MTGIAANGRSAIRRALIARAQDVTDTVVDRSALIIAPHPDDETLGCGARILRSRRLGISVTVVVATTGGRSHDALGADPVTLEVRRRDELKWATHCLDLEPDAVIELGFADGELSGHLAELADRVGELIQHRKPDDVYVTSAAEWHPDHAAAARAAAIATRQTPSTVRLLEYPIWLWTDWPISRRHRDGRDMLRAAAILTRRKVEKVRVDDVYTKKKTALHCYTSQLGDEVTLPQQIVSRALNDPELYFRASPHPRNSTA